ncbi:probable tubulin polyglutamylase ttll-15 isoform X2 [Amphiura filiformis]|uniref:probable tubulin polyglutamylase ttll-15 isoform X2 n=1 Tax=Amphiura filiformis TaxID=82378 RepID=UPI003B214D1B
MKYKMARQGVTCTLAIAISMQLYFLYLLQSEESHCVVVHSTFPCTLPRRPVVILGISRNEEKRYQTGIQLAMDTFSRLGFRTHRSYEDTKPDNCDIVWTHTYPFRHDKIVELFTNPKHNVKINHFPGIASICVKAVLNTASPVSKYIPKTYKMPDDRKSFIDEVSKIKNREKEQVWVEKKSSHRNVTVKATHEIDLDSEGIIQTFIHNQFLLYGHVISLGVMVIITSVSPLRVYTLDNGWMVRIANKPYHPVNYSDFETFITNSGSNNLFEFEPMRRFFDHTRYSRRQALIAHLLSDLGVEQSKVQSIREQVFDAVHDVVYNRRGILGNVINGNKRFGNYSSFFEVTRWDFIIDENMKVYLIEANMSPNLMTSHFLARAKNYNTIFNTITTIGYRHGSWNTNGIRDKDINVDIKVCFTEICKACELKECYLCSKCLPDEIKQMLRTSYMEHVNRLGLRRVHPKPLGQEAANKLREQNFGNLSRELINQAWITAKCVEDEYWCT